MELLGHDEVTQVVINNVLRDKRSVGMVKAGDRLMANEGLQGTERSLVASFLSRRHCDVLVPRLAHQRPAFGFRGESSNPGGDARSGALASRQKR